MLGRLLVKALGGILLPSEAVLSLERRLSILEEDYELLEDLLEHLKVRVDEFTGIKSSA